MAQSPCRITYTVRYFLDITKEAYGGSVIRKVREKYDNKGEE